MDGKKLQIVANKLPGPPVLDEMKLYLEGSRLHLYIVSEEMKKSTQYARVWELPLFPHPQQIIAKYIGTTLKIHVDVEGSERAFMTAPMRLQASPAGT